MHGFGINENIHSNFVNKVMLKLMWVVIDMSQVF